MQSFHTAKLWDFAREYFCLGGEAVMREATRGLARSGVEFQNFGQWEADITKEMLFLDGKTLHDEGYHVRQLYTKTYCLELNQ